MKLQVLQENLSKALSISTRFTSSKVQLPILANILLKASKNKLEIAATNLETSISLKIGAKVEKTGDITVPARTINDLVGNLSTGQVSLEAKKEQLKISASGFQSKLSGVNSSDFPKLPGKSDKGVIDLPQDDLSAALSQVLFAVSPDETRPVLTGILFIIDKGNISLVATDGFRLSQKKLNIKPKYSGDELRLIIPKNTLSELTRLFNSEKVGFSFNKSDNQVIFDLPDIVLTSRVIEGEFPDFERIIPKDTKIEVNVDKDELLRAVKLASVFARDAANVVKVDIDKNSLKILAESSQSGSQETQVDAKIEGVEKELKIAFNYRFLEEFLNSVEGDDVTIKLTDANSPTVFLDPKDKEYLHIIMPVRLQE
jgi:DNA polymerase-3 subunit beta